MKSRRIVFLIVLFFSLTQPESIVAGERLICPALDEVTAVFTTNRTAVATAKAFSQVEARLLPYWRDEPYKSNKSIDRLRYEMEMAYWIMSQNVDTSSGIAMFESFRAKIRLTRSLGWFMNCPTKRIHFLAMAYHVKRDYSHDKADTIRDFWMAERKVNPRLLPYGICSKTTSNIMQNTEVLRSYIMKYRGEALDVSALWARQFKEHVTAEEYQSAKKEFTKIAELTPEEVRQVFGSLPESSNGTSGDPTTNITTNAP